MFNTVHFASALRQAHAEQRVIFETTRAVAAEAKKARHKKKPHKTMQEEAGE